jgi:signal transduction histidine kinase
LYAIFSISGGDKMKDQDKSKQELTDELRKMRQRLAELEVLESHLEEAERAIEEAREYAQSIVATVREPLIVLDADLRVVSASRSFYRTFKVSPEETEGQLIYELGDRQWDIPRLRELLEGILPQNSVFNDFVVEHDFPTIGRRMMVLNARRIHGQGDSTRLILLAIEDETDRKRAEQALRGAQEQLVRQERMSVLGQLAGGVGHELRNPLGAIKNAAYFLNMALEKPEPEVGETLQILEKEVTTAERIISSLLDFARPRPPSRRKVEVNGLLEETLSNVSMPENGEVVRRLDEALPAILGDPDQLRQVFGNIILNAIQAMPEGGKLAVTSEAPSPGWVAVSITDTGEGILEENVEKVFEPLFTTKAKGIGLGLALTKTLVEGHGGSIEVQSEVGKGSTFRVKLPVSGKEEK